MKKTIFAISLAGMVSLQGENGMMDRPSSNESSGGCPSRCESSCCGENCCVPQPKKCIDCVSYTPPFYDLQCDCGFFISADFLYWYGKETGLAFAHRVLTVAAEQVNILGTGGVTEALGPRITTPNDYKYLDGQWDPGFRIGVGWNSACDGWDLYLNWTYYYTKEKRTVDVEPFPSTIDSTGAVEAAVIPNMGQFGLLNPWINPALVTLEQDVLGVGNSISIWDQIKARWKLQLNLIDLELGRKYWLSPCMSMRPYIGVRGAWTRIRFQTKSHRFTDSDEEERTYKTKDRFKDDFWGVGLVGGFQPEWHLSKCFTLFGKADFSLLWGCFDLDRDTTSTINSLLTNGDTQADFWKYSSDNEFSEMQSILDLAIGLRWESTFCCDRYRLTFDAGWEHHLWLDHIHRSIFSGTSFSTTSISESEGSVGQTMFDNLGYTAFKEAYGNLILGGLVLELRFDF